MRGQCHCRARHGFSLIELLIVISVIGIIATIAIPILMSVRARSLDEKARQSIRTVNTGQQAFYAHNGRFGGLDELANSVPPYLDTRFSSGTGLMGNGLEISLTVSNGGESFSVSSDNPLGSHNYSSDESFEIQEL